MLQLIYVSTATRAMTEDDLEDILRAARSRNKEMDVTGLLLYRDGAFIQVLEGEDDAVQEIYDLIESDERHRGVTLLSTTSIEEREFPNWQMGFRHLGDEDLRDLDGFSSFMDDDVVRQLRSLVANPSFAREALLKFKTSDSGGVSEAADSSE